MAKYWVRLMLANWPKIDLKEYQVLILKTGVRVPVGSVCFVAPPAVSTSVSTSTKLVPPQAVAVRVASRSVALLSPAPVPTDASGFTVPAKFDALHSALQFGVAS